MAKLIKPTRGVNTQDLLLDCEKRFSAQKEWAALKGKQGVEELNDMARLKAGHYHYLANVDGCLSEDQKLFIFDLIFQEVNAEKEAQGHSDEYNLHHATRDIAEVRLHLISLVLSGRLSCENCLNEECNKRDSDVPVELVQKRAKEMESRSNSIN